jgi:hypothetical protein
MAVPSVSRAELTTSLRKGATPKRGELLFHRFKAVAARPQIA